MTSMTMNETSLIEIVGDFLGPIEIEQQRLNNFRRTSAGGYYLRRQRGFDEAPSTYELRLMHATTNERHRIQLEDGKVPAGTRIPAGAYSFSVSENETGATILDSVWIQTGDAGPVDLTRLGPLSDEQIQEILNP